MFVRLRLIKNNINFYNKFFNIKHFTSQIKILNKNSDFCSEIEKLKQKCESITNKSHIDKRVQNFRDSI